MASGRRAVKIATAPTPQAMAVVGINDVVDGQEEVEFSGEDKDQQATHRYSSETR